MTLETNLFNKSTCLHELQNSGTYESNCSAHFQSSQADEHKAWYLEQNDEMHQWMPALTKFTASNVNIKREK